MNNDDIIRKTAIEFINCYWNIPYYVDDTFIEYLGDHIGKPDLALDEYIAMLNADIKECCFLLSEFAIDDHETFMYFADRIQDRLIHIRGVDDEGCFDYRTVVTLLYEVEWNEKNVAYQFPPCRYKCKKHFIIADDRYFEAGEVTVQKKEWRAG